MATKQPGTKLTTISGMFRGRRCVHQADVFDKSKESPYPASHCYVTDAGNHQVQLFRLFSLVFGLGGKFLDEWGTEGADEGQFREPITLVKLIGARLTVQC